MQTVVCFTSYSVVYHFVFPLGSTEDSKHFEEVSAEKDCKWWILWKMKGHQSAHAEVMKELFSNRDS